MTREEDKILDSLWQALEAGELDGRHALRPPLPAESEELQREYIEILGLVPYELEPMEPSPESRERLLRSVAEEPRHRVVPLQPVQGAAAPDVDRMAPGPMRGWPRALAAALVLVAIGLAGATGYLFQRLQEHQRRLGELQIALRQNSAETEQVRTQLASMREKWGIVTTAGVEVCPLRPTGDEMRQPRAEGRLWVHPNRQDWVLTLSNLEPSGEGRQYHVWFISNGRPVRAKSFTMQADGSIEITDDSMPGDFTAVMVTLEEREAAQPAGPTVLYGDEAQQML